MPIDANVERIITRIHSMLLPVGKIQQDLELYSSELIDKNRPGDMIEALMDFGSIICRPKNPKCDECCIVKYCNAYKKNLTSKIPVKKTLLNINKPILYSSAYIITNYREQILLRRRANIGMLPYMLEVPMSKWQKKPINNKNIKKNSPINLCYEKINKQISYSFSHLILKVNIYHAKTKKKSVRNSKWYKLKNTESLDLPTIMKKIINIYLLK